MSKKDMTVRKERTIWMARAKLRPQSIIEVGPGAPFTNMLLEKPSPYKSDGHDLWYSRSCPLAELSVAQERALLGRRLKPGECVAYRLVPEEKPE